jgi:hypothetical protein
MPGTTMDAICGQIICTYKKNLIQSPTYLQIVPFTTSMEERERCYSFVLSRTLHETFFSLHTFMNYDLKGAKYCKACSRCSNLNLY